MLEILTAILFGYFIDINIGILIGSFINLIFNENTYKSLFMIFNIFIYLLFGWQYIVFIKLYIIISLLIFLQGDIFLRSIKLNFIRNKLKDYYDFGSNLIFVPLSIIYDNILHVINLSGILDIIVKNKYYVKYTNLKKKIFNNLFFNSDEFLNDNFDETFDNIFNENKFIDMTNNMRTTIGKNPITLDEINTKINNLNLDPLMIMLNKSFDDYTNALKKYEKTD
jgi:hypothetical protein